MISQGEFVRRFEPIKKFLIDWYVWDTNMGKRRMEAGYDGKLTKISDTKKLYKLIMAGKARGEKENG